MNFAAGSRSEEGTVLLSGQPDLADIQDAAPLTMTTTQQGQAPASPEKRVLPATQARTPPTASFGRNRCDRRSKLTFTTLL